MVERIYIEFRNVVDGKKADTEFRGRTFEYGERVRPKDLKITVNEAEELAANSGGLIKLIRKKR